jgi:hypothetical protein
MSPSVGGCVTPRSRTAARFQGFHNSITYKKINSRLIAKKTSVRLLFGQRLRGRPTVASCPHALLIPPALVQFAQKFIVKAVPGRLLLAAARRGGPRLAGPLTVGLFVYSVAVTVWAALSTTKKPKSTQKDIITEEEVDRQCSGSENNPCPCPVCHGNGTITWEAKFLHEGDPCPLCLGTGVAPRQQDNKEGWLRIW